ncbi:cell surface hyaluronidase CEMIP2-like isoform X2 [Phalacrocorax aristotelis]|uniref:cell surface hyaluronidase CEMIP2-like isoform X2 n=1 Tax=Phalacrocorax aristotelis TaxID=126867 RepID=UPI003F4C0AC9
MCLCADSVQSARVAGGGCPAARLRGAAAAAPGRTERGDPPGCAAPPARRAGAGAGPGAAAGRAGEQRAAAAHQGPARRPPRTSPRGDPAPTPAAPPWWAGGRPCAWRAPPPSTPSSSATEGGWCSPTAPTGRPSPCGPATSSSRTAGSCTSARSAAPTPRGPLSRCTGAPPTGRPWTASARSSWAWVAAASWSCTAGGPAPGPSWTKPCTPAGSATAPTPPRSGGAAAGSTCASWTPARRGCWRRGASTPTCGPASAGGCAPSWPSRAPAAWWRPPSGTRPPAASRWRRGCCCGTASAAGTSPAWATGVPRNGFKVEASKGIILHLADEVTSWLPGDRIVVASTDYSMHQAEEFNLLPCPECKSNQVKIDGSPLYLHIGEVIDGVDMRAEVGLLTRNILIQGEMEDSCYGQNQCQFFSFDTFGGHIKILRNFSSVHMSGVELKNMGQQILGSYPVHFHLAEDVDERGGYKRPTYLDNLAIHHCFSRCVAIHGTHGLLVKDTIGYDTLGHCFFLEDGTEQRNTFYHNLGLLTRSGTILPSDRNEAMCLAIRTHVYGNYVPVPSTDCMAVSTFWIANPNNNLIKNAAAGAQDVGIWYIFHRVPTGQSEGQYPEGQAEHTPMGVFYNNRVHSNFKAGLFIGKGVKTTRASAEDPREYLTVDNARFHPHQDADPEKPRVPAVIDSLIAFKNNDHGAWARGGDIIFRNSGFSDNGIGLTLASDGTFPTDEGSSLEVTRSIFVGESSNFGSQGGQNSYWGKGANGEYRTLPRNKTFPIRGFQIYDGPVRMAKCTFKKFTPTVDRYSSAIGFFMKNSWQISPQNNMSQILMEKSVGLKVFFGRSGQWFGNNNNDGDKTSIFHDLDGSVTGYRDTFIGRADNYLLRHPGCLTVPRWNGVMCTGKFAQLYIQARRPENLTLSIARAAYHSHPLQLQGVNRGAPYQQYQPVVMLEQAYIIQWDGRAPEDIILYPINFNRGDWLHVALCYPREAIFQVVTDIYQRQTGMVHSVKHYLAAPSRASALNRTSERLFYFDRASGYLFVHLQAHEARKGHSYCSQQGCERIKIMAHMYPGDSWSCDPNPFLERPAAAQRPVSQHLSGPCRACGAPQLAITSTPSVKYIRIQIQSLSRVDMQNHLTSAFIKINDTVFPFNSRGIFFVVLDACSGAVVSRRHFDTVTGENAASAITDYVQTFIEERSLVLVCSRDIADMVGSSEMSAFTRLGSAKPVVLHKEEGHSLCVCFSGSFAMLGYKGQAKPSWIKVLNHAGYQKAASLQHYVPLKLKEYQCPANADESLKFAFSQNRSEHISAEPSVPWD